MKWARRRVDSTMVELGRSTRLIQILCTELSICLAVPSEEPGDAHSLGGVQVVRDVESRGDCVGRCLVEEEVIALDDDEVGADGDQTGDRFLDFTPEPRRIYRSGLSATEAIEQVDETG